MGKALQIASSPGAQRVRAQFTPLRMRRPAPRSGRGQAGSFDRALPPIPITGRAGRLCGLP